MGKIPQRPFYAEYAWAYDVIIGAPVKARCDFCQDAFSRRGVPPGATILDAGCGTGSYALGLAQRGYAVTGIDASPALVAIAREKTEGVPVPPTIRVADALTLPSEPKHDGILCRGVLNDIIDDGSRQEAFHSFARALRKLGVLILDVREWNATVARKRSEPVVCKSVRTERGTLTFRSLTRLDPQARQLLVAEHHTLEKDGKRTASGFDFVMRCWTKDELQDNLTSAGFGRVAFFGDYDSDKPPGFADRIVAVATLKH